MAKIGIPENESKKSMLTSIYEAIIVINPKITIVVPTSTLNLVGTENVFDIVVPVL